MENVGEHGKIGQFWKGTWTPLGDHLRLTVNVLVFLLLTVNFFPLRSTDLIVRQTLPMASNTFVLRNREENRLFSLQILVSS